MGCIIVTSFYCFPDGREVLQKDLYFPEERDIMELRKKTNWIKGAHGHFAGSYPEGGGGGTGGNSGLTNEKERDIMSVGSDTMPVAEKEEEYGVPYGADAVNADMQYINSEEFAKKFEGITDNPKVNQTLLECSRAAIEHRNGTLYEDMYLINGNTGEIISRQINALKEQQINYTDEMLESIKEATVNRSPIIALHTHPGGYPPSIDDFNSVFEHGYALGVVAGHNGQVYKFQNKGRYISDPENVQLNIAIAYSGGVDVDRAHREAFALYGLNYEIVKE